MMLNLRIVELRDTFYNYLPIISCLGFFLFFELFFFVYFYYSITVLNLERDSNDFLIMWKIYNYWCTNIDLIGQLLFNNLNHLFLIAGLILLVSMIGAIILTTDSNYRKFQIKKQKLYDSCRTNIANITFWKKK